MTLLLSEPTRPEIHETDESLVVEVPVPDGFDPALVSMRVHEGVLEIRVPLGHPWPGQLARFHPDACGV
jgi:hypothetical protein